MIPRALQKVTERRHRQCSAHWGSQHVCKNFETVRTFYTLFIATDANATPYAACYVQFSCAWVEKFQATPSARALGLSGSEQGGVHFKDKIDFGAWHLGYSQLLKEQSVHWHQKSLYHDYGRRAFTVTVRSCRSRQLQSVFFEHLRVTSWPWYFQKCHLPSDKEFNLIVTHLNSTTWHSFLILSSLIELPSCGSVFL